MSISQAKNSSESVSLLLIASQHFFRESMIRFLHSLSDRFVVSSAGRGDEGITLAQTLQPHIVLVDLAISGASQLGVIRHLQRAAPTARIIALASYNIARARDDALCAGAHALLDMFNLSDELTPAIRQQLPSFFAAGELPGHTTAYHPGGDTRETVHSRQEVSRFAKTTHASPTSWL